MSNLIMPPGITLPEPIQQQDEPSPEVPIEERGRMIPTAVGWKLVCVVPDVSEKFENSSLIKAESVMRAEEFTTVVLFVVAVGPDAYKDTAKFPTGPWCKQGDFVLVRQYAGTRLKIYGKEFRIINDDQVESVVDDPRGITRA